MNEESTYIQDNSCEIYKKKKKKQGKEGNVNLREVP